MYSSSPSDSAGKALVPNDSLSLAPILVADDDADDLFFAVRLIKRTGTHHPVVTFDGGAGMADYLSRAWLTHPEPRDVFPRLLFLDLKMSGLGGFEFLKWIAGHTEFASLHVVVLSGSEEPEDAQRALALGAKRYLTKHPSVSTFARIIEHVYGADAVASRPLRREAAPGYNASNVPN